MTLPVTCDAGVTLTARPVMGRDGVDVTCEERDALAVASPGFILGGGGATSIV